MKRGGLLLVPTLEKGQGGGHLIRSMILTRALRQAGREAFLYIPEETGLWRAWGADFNKGWIISDSGIQRSSGPGRLWHQ